MRFRVRGFSHLAEPTGPRQILLSLWTNLIAIPSDVDMSSGSAPSARRHLDPMPPTLDMQYLLLDDDGRPLRRISATAGWSRVVHELLEHGSQWLVIEQQRLDGQPLAPQWEDIRLSRAICRQLRPMDVKLADHVIQGRDDRFSFRAAGLL